MAGFGLRLQHNRIGRQLFHWRLAKLYRHRMPAIFKIVLHTKIADGADLFYDREPEANAVGRLVTFFESLKQFFGRYDRADLYC